MTDPAVTRSDLLDAGWQRSFVGAWLSPAGDRVVSEADALREVTRERILGSKRWQTTTARPEES